MQPDDFIGDAFSDLDEDGFDYDDGFEPDLIDDEADYVSASKRRVKTKGEATRSRTPGVMRSVNRSKHKHSRREQKRAIRQVFMRKANALWNGKIKKEFRTRLPWLTEALLSLMLNQYLMRANALITAKMSGATSLSGLGKISVKSMIAVAMAALAERDRRITPAQANDHAQNIYNGLTMVEKFIEILVMFAGSFEDEYELEDEDLLEWEDGFDDEGFEEEDWQAFDDEYEAQPRSPAQSRRPAPKTTPIQCARALRQAAKYLLRVERQLAANGRRP